MGRQIGHHLIIFRGAHMAGIDGVGNVGQQYFVFILAVWYNVICYHLVDDGNTDNITLLNGHTGIRFHLVEV